ncbi:MAG: hypothetical protein MJE68_15395, partial [Proteobacteria bacterium]|nr:hypothetical protein [Pseudomonadota bacterium]
HGKIKLPGYAYRSYTSPTICLCIGSNSVRLGFGDNPALPSVQVSFEIEQPVFFRAQPSKLATL